MGLLGGIMVFVLFNIFMIPFVLTGRFIIRKIKGIKGEWKNNFLDYFSPFTLGVSAAHVTASWILGRPSHSGGGILWIMLWVLIFEWIWKKLRKRFG
jgi:hypothetical protein